jgi:Dirigent-like protein
VARFPLVRLVTPAAFLVTALLVTALPATASRTASNASMTIRLISVPGRTTVVRDLPPNGSPSKGDVYRGTSILRNEVAQFGRPKGARVGTDSYTITFTSPTRGQIKITVKLPGGTLRAEGRTSLTGSADVSVVGGTGAFAGARGTAQARDLANGTSRNVYRLRLP